MEYRSAGLAFTVKDADRTMSYFRDVLGFEGSVPKELLHAIIGESRFHHGAKGQAAHRAGQFGVSSAVP